MLDPLPILASVSGVLGLGTLVTGRSLFDRGRWQLSGWTLRLAGGYIALLSVLVIALDLLHAGGFAFMAYGVGVLAFAATAQVIRRRSATN